MAQANVANTINIENLRTDIDDDPRVFDFDLADGLGFSRKRKIREIITRHASELCAYGDLTARSAATRLPSAKVGRPGTAYFLNEPQALLICMWSNTAQAATVRKMLIDVFMEFRRQQLSSKTIHVREHDRRPSTKMDKAISLARSADRLERVADQIDPPARNFCAMVVNGEHVFVDTNDYRMYPGDRAVVIQWDGSLVVSDADNHYSDMLFAGHRAGLQPETVSGAGTRTRAACVIVGKIMKTVHIPILAGQSTQVRPARFRDNIVQMINQGHDNLSIARRLGCNKETVRRRRADMMQLAI